MKVDLNLYAIALGQIQKLSDANPNITTSKLIERAIGFTTVPCIVAAYFVGDVRGYDETVKRTIETAMIFYNYDEVVPLKKSDTETEKM